MNTYTVEIVHPDDNRTIRHQCVDYINATVAFDAAWPRSPRPAARWSCCSTGRTGARR